MAGVGSKGAACALTEVDGEWEGAVSLLSLQATRLKMVSIDMDLKEAQRRMRARDGSVWEREVRVDSRAVVLSHRAPSWECRYSDVSVAGARD